MSAEIRPTQLLYWKYSTCECCEFREGCPCSKYNLQTCYEETFADIGYATVAGLAKKTLLKVTAWAKRGGTTSSKVGGLKVIAAKAEPIDQSAVLYCSDLKEYLQCLHSRSQ